MGSSGMLREAHIARLKGGITLISCHTVPKYDFRTACTNARPETCHLRSLLLHHTDLFSHNRHVRFLSNLQIF